MRTIENRYSGSHEDWAFQAGEVQFVEEPEYCPQCDKVVTDDDCVQLDLTYDGKEAYVHICSECADVIVKELNAKWRSPKYLKNQ